jgi:hypothetical protein
MKDVITHDWGEEKIDLRHLSGALEGKPTEIHHKSNGSIKDEPTFTFIIEREGAMIDKIQMYGQISLEMLNQALGELGYEIKKKI